MSVASATYLMLSGQWADAMEDLDSLPAYELVTPSIMAMRMRCCQGQEKWEVGQELAEMLSKENEPGRKAAARFWHARAVDHARKGRCAQGRDAVSKAVAAWPRHSGALHKDPKLKALWIP